MAAVASPNSNASSAVPGAADKAAALDRPDREPAIKLDFPLAKTTVAREGSDLLFTPLDKAPVRLVDFFAENAAPAAAIFVFFGCPPLAWTDLLEFLHIDPERAGTFWTATALLGSSSGLSQYDDSPGELIHDVPRFGMLDPVRNEPSGLPESDGLPYASGAPLPEENKSADAGPSAITFTFSETELMDTPVHSGVLSRPGLAGAIYSLKGGNGTGRFGFFTLDADGAWSYARTADINYMAQGKHYKDSFTAIARMPDGSAEEWTVTIDITGDDDAPTLAVDAAFSDDAALASGIAMQGRITGSDIDQGDRVADYRIGADGATARLLQGGALSLVNLDSYGVLRVNADGAWSFAPQSQAQKENLLSLAAGQELFITAPVIATDAYGQDGDALLVITISGTDQAPVFDAATMTARTEEDALLNAGGFLSGRIAARDYEGSAIGYTPETVQGLYGEFTIEEDGQWRYALRPGLDINFMSEGQAYVERFPVTVSDSLGNSSQEQFTLVITGDNDMPVILGAGSGTPNLNAPDGVALAGHMLASDVDMGDEVGNFRIVGGLAATINGATPVELGDYGRFILDPDGSWRFVAETAQQRANLLALESGETLTLSMTVQAFDAHGGVGGGTVTIYVNGTNAAPEFDALSLSAGVTENDLLAQGVLTGSIWADDANAGDTVTYSLVGSGAGAYGALTVQSDGSWVYTPTTDINFMADGASHAERFMVRAFDNRGGVDERELVITITGNNDDPVVRDATALATDQEFYDAGLLSGRISISDVDAGDAISSVTVGSIGATLDGVGVFPGDYGVLSVDADGNWRFEAQTEAQKEAMLRLPAGAVLVITAEIAAQDQNNGSGSGSGVLTITVSGVNQAPSFTSSTLSANATEQSLMTSPAISGQLDATDPDRGDRLTYAIKGHTGAGNYGYFTLTENGVWTYTRTADISFLPQGQSLAERFTALVSDGKGGVTEQVFVLTIQGDNSAPVLQSLTAEAKDADLAGGLTLSGVIAGRDPDAGDSVGGYAAGTVTAMRGAEEEPVERYGALRLGSDGRWTFKAETQAQKEALLGLAEGERLVITVPVSAQDSHGLASNTASLTITVTGANQWPVFEASTLVASIGEDAIVAQGLYSGRLAAFDPDSGDVLTYSLPGGGNGVHGVCDITPEGVWTYVPTGDVNRLAAGERLVERFTVLVSDGKGGVATQTLTLTIEGANDAPVLQDAAASGTDAALAAGPGFSGRISGEDPESDPFTYSAGPITATVNDVAVNAEDYGTLVMRADGNWTFAALTKAQESKLLGLAEGETLEIAVPVTGTDIHGAAGSSVLTITVTGVNQAPAFDEATLSPLVSENDDAGQGAYSGRLAAVDPEGDALTYSVKESAGAHGTLTITGDGAWLYTPATDLSGLAEGENLTDSFTVVVTDVHGLATEETFTITVNGVNSAPVLQNAEATVTDAALAGGLTLSGSISGEDPEGNPFTYSAGKPEAALNGVRVDAQDYGELVVQEDGGWSFTAVSQAQKDKALGLAEGETLVIAVPVTGTDSLGAAGGGFLTITVIGANQAPVAEAGPCFLTGEDALMAVGASVSGSISIKEYDNGDSCSYALASPAAGMFGVLELAPSGGSWTYTPLPGLDLNFMAQGTSYLDRFTVVVTDSHGAATETVICINIAGSNDALIFTGATQNELNLVSPPDGVVLSGNILTHDADEGDTASGFALAGAPTAQLNDGSLADLGVYGDLRIAENGTWELTSSNPDQLAALESLISEGKSLTITVPVKARDSAGDEETGTVTITVGGNNNAPRFTLSSLERDTSEDSLMASHAITGTLLAEDDDGDTLVYALPEGGQGTFGALTLTSGGVWTYTLHQNIDTMAPGQTYSEHFRVLVSDGKGGRDVQTLTISIAGNNDAPVFAASSLSAAVREDALVVDGACSGQLLAVDPDDGALLTYSIKAGTDVGAYGSFSVDGNGRWTYTPTGAINELAGGQTHKETFTAVVDDGKGGVSEQVFTLTLIGDNDAPVLQSAAVSGLTDQGLSNGLLVEGQISASDVDLGDSVSGFTTGVISATLNGAPVNPSGYGVFALLEDGFWTFQAQTEAQKKALLALADDQQLILTVPVTAHDSHNATGGATLTITIDGTNQDPEFIAASLTAAVHEDALVIDGACGGQLLAIDPDSGAALTYSIKAGSGAGTYGNFSISGDGRWTYTPAEDINKLAGGLAYTETFTAVVTDGKGGEAEQAFTLTIAGNNDAPVLQNAAVSGLTDQELSAGLLVEGQISASDVDLGDSVSGFSPGVISATLNGAPVNPALYGALTMDGAGKWAFQAQTEAQKKNLLALTENQQLILTVPVTAHDSHNATGGATLTITIDGTNQNPEFVAASLTAAVHEDAIAARGSCGGQLLAADPDSGAALTYSIKAGSGAGLYGNFSISSDGQWTYTPTGDINRLAGGRTYTESFTAVVDDGKGGVSEQKFTLTIAGDNDAPVLQNAAAAIVDELLAGGLICAGQISGSDADAGDTVTYTAGAPLAMLNGTPVSFAAYGDFSMNADGNWSFTPATKAQQAAVLALGAGQNLVLTVTVTGTDASGASASSTLTITVKGQDAAAPVVVSRYEEEVTASEATGSFSVSDALSYALADPGASRYISITMDAGGNYAYSFTPEGIAYCAALNAGSAALSIPYTVNVTLPGGAVVQRTLAIEITPTNAHHDVLHISASAAAAGLGLATHNPLDSAQSADHDASVFYLDRSDGLYQGNDTVTIDSGVGNISVYTCGGDDSLSATGVLSGTLLDAGGGVNAIALGSLNAGPAGNTIRSEAGTMTVNAVYTKSGGLYGLTATGGNRNTLEGVTGGAIMAGTASITAIADAGAAYALYSAAGTNTVRASTLCVNASGSAAYGLYAAGAGSLNALYADKATILSSLKGSGAVYGLFASGSGAGNTIASAGALDLSIKADTSGGTPLGTSWGIYAEASGNNSITGNSAAGFSDKVSVACGIKAATGGVNAVATGAGADNISVRGPMEASGGANRINSGDGDDDICIHGNVSAAVAGSNTFMLGAGHDTLTVNGSITASGAGSTNSIIGNSVAGTCDTVIINGNISNTGGGSTKITTGAGGDFINITGAITGAGAVVATGAGNDTIRIHGSVAKGSLAIQGGEGSADTLVLASYSVLDFDADYLPWLKDMLNNTNHGIERILIEGVDLVQLVALTTFIIAYNLTHSPDIELGVWPLPLALGADAPETDAAVELSLAALLGEEEPEADLFAFTRTPALWEDEAPAGADALLLALTPEAAYGEGGIPHQDAFLPAPVGPGDTLPGDTPPAARPAGTPPDHDDPEDGLFTLSRADLPALADILALPESLDELLPPACAQIARPDAPDIRHDAALAAALPAAEAASPAGDPDDYQDNGPDNRPADWPEGADLPYLFSHEETGADAAALFAMTQGL